MIQNQNLSLPNAKHRHGKIRTASSSNAGIQVKSKFNSFRLFQPVRMMKALAIGMSVLLLTGYQTVSAQKVWTLEDCIRYALENNIQVKRQTLETQYRQNNLTQSRMEILPNLGAGGSHSYSSGRYYNPITYQYEADASQSGNVGLSSSVNLFSGFRTWNTIARNRYNFMASLQDLEKAKNDISLNIASSYLQILFNGEILAMAKKQYEVTSLQVEKNRRLVEAGNLAKGSLFEIQAQASSEKAGITQAENQLKLSYLDLTQLLDLDSAENFVIRKPDSIDIAQHPNILPVDTFYSQAVQELPQIQSAELKLKGYEQDLKIARASAYPQLSLQGTLSSWYKLKATRGVNNEKYPLADQILDHRNNELTLSLNIPIFSRFSISNQIKNAKIQVLDMDYNLQQQKQILYKEIQKAHADAKAALAQYNSSMEAVISNEEAFKYMQQKLDVGLVSSVDYNIAKTNLLKAQSDLIQAKYEYIFKLKVLDFYLGKPITLENQSS